MKRSFILVAHGSRDPQTVRQIHSLTAEIRRLSGVRLARYAFLRLGRPGFFGAAAACVRAGAKEIMVLPHFLNAGGHLKRDLPALVRKAEKIFRGTLFCLLPHLGSSPLIAGVYAGWMTPGRRAKKKKRRRQS